MSFERDSVSYRTISSGSDEDYGASHRTLDGSAMISREAPAHSGPSRSFQVSILDTSVPTDDQQISAKVLCTVCHQGCDLHLRPVPGNPLRMAYLCPLPRGGHGFVFWVEDPRVTLYRIKRAVVQRTDYLKQRLDSVEAIMAIDRERMSRLEAQLRGGELRIFPALSFTSSLIVFFFIFFGIWLVGRNL